MDFAIGGVAVIALVFGVVEAAKEFGVTGKASRVLALVLAGLFIGIAQADAQELLSEDAMAFVKLIVGTLAGTLSAMGLYDFSRKLNAND